MLDKGKRFEAVLTFCGQEGQFFTILCGHLLWAAPYSMYRAHGTMQKSKV